MMAAIEYALCTVGACMLGTRGANLNLVGDQLVPLETTNTSFIISFSTQFQYLHFIAMNVFSFNHHKFQIFSFIKNVSGEVNIFGLRLLTN